MQNGILVIENAIDPAHRRWTDLLFASQQDDHQDRIDLTTFPPGYMCGTWIALQGVQADNGELVYLARV